MNKTFVRVRSIKDIVIFTSLIIIGSVLAALPTGTGINIAGFFMIFAGIITIFVLKTGYKDTATGDKYKKTLHYFQQAMKPEILSAMESKPGNIDLTQADKGNAVELDIYYSSDSGKAYLQLFEYIPYKYEPCTRMYEYEMKEVEKLIR